MAQIIPNRDPQPMATEQHRHLIDKAAYQKQAAEGDESARIRLLALSGIIELASLLRRNTPLCYEDACNLIVELI